MAFQIFTGLVLRFYFVREESFSNIIFIRREGYLGRTLRSFHGNGVSLFFLALFLHVFRGLIFSRYVIIPVWLVGVVILFISVLVGFLGYSLP